MTRSYSEAPYSERSERLRASEASALQRAKRSALPIYLGWPEPNGRCTLLSVNTIDTRAPRFVTRYAVAIFLITMGVVAVLWLNALTPIFHFSVGPYAIGVTWLLAQAGIILLNTFSEFMRLER